jgi:flagellar motor switch protein FliM
MPELEDSPESIVVPESWTSGEGDKKIVKIHDFRSSPLLSPGELRKLKSQQEEFAQHAATRLSLHLRLEFSLKLTSINTISYQNLAESWGHPAHLTLFKMDPLRGVSIMEISSQLGLCMVDRLMGGPGHVPPTDQETSEIEKVLLEQSVQLILEEWCDHWSGVMALKPVILGYESNDGFVQTLPPETMMLVVGMEAGFGECTGRIQLGFPFSAVDPMIRRFCNSATAGTNPAATPAPPPTAATGKWNRCFDDVCVPVTAEWDGLEMSAREILELKIGDILPLDWQRAQQINVRVADMLKFHGRPGTLAGQWAVELTQVINR